MKRISAGAPTNAQANVNTGISRQAITQINLSSPKTTLMLPGANTSRRNIFQLILSLSINCDNSCAEQLYHKSKEKQLANTIRPAIGLLIDSAKYAGNPTIMINIAKNNPRSIPFLLLLRYASKNFVRIILCCSTAAHIAIS